MKSKRLTGLLALIAFASCATIRHGDSEPIFVSSDPTGADAVVHCRNGVSEQGTTPARLLIPRTGDGCVVEVSKTGFTSRSIPLERGYNAAFWTNFVPASGLAATPPALFGGYDGWGGLLAVGVVGAIGFAVDRASGRGYGHNPDHVDVKLEQVK
jgi:hypothetical protein